jgi:hypothetical protein
MATSAKTTPPCRWLSLAHWRLMLAPARLDIVEAMRSLGPSSIKEVAAAVGRPATSLYPHFKLLMRIGVVVEEAPRRLAKHVERVFRLAADVNKAALMTARGIFNSAQHAFRRAAKAQVLQAGGGTLNHGLVHELLWLSPSEFVEVLQKLREIKALSSRRKNPHDRQMHLLVASVVPLAREKSKAPPGKQPRRTSRRPTADPAKFVQSSRKAKDL